jgi:2-polyprenyl-3-methyl-5-hydroxy-6-metoxy-1,4-benzoquinol methylase
MTSAKQVIEHFRKAVRDYASLRTEGNLPLPLQKGRLLEAGCGSRLTYKADLEAFALDTSRELIKLLHRKSPQTNIVLADVKSPPFREGSFDVVVANNLLHHLVSKVPSHCEANIRQALQSMKVTLSQEGILLIKETLVANRWLNLLFYFVTLICAKVRITIIRLDIRHGVVIFFLDPRRLRQITDQLGLHGSILSSKDWSIMKISVGKLVDIFYQRESA